MKPSFLKACSQYRLADAIHYSNQSCLFVGCGGAATAVVPTPTAPVTELDCAAVAVVPLPPAPPARHRIHVPSIPTVDNPPLRSPTKPRRSSPPLTSTCCGKHSCWTSTTELIEARLSARSNTFSSPLAFVFVGLRRRDWWCSNWFRRTYSGWATGLPLRVDLLQRLSHHRPKVLVRGLVALLSTLISGCKTSLQLFYRISLLFDLRPKILFIHNGIVRRWLILECS